MEDASGITKWTYNELGQLIKEKRTIEGTDYIMEAEYDAFGRPLNQTLPSSETLTYSYNDMGALAGLSGTNTYVSDIHYDPSGQMTDQVLGNGLIQQSCYDPNTLRLVDLRVYSGSSQTCANTPSSPSLNLVYMYEPNGNISRIIDLTQNETTSYTYDELDRLLSAKGPYERDYGYDAIGNLTLPASTPSNPGTNGLVAWWSLNETNGWRFDSHSGNHLADNNTVTSAAGLQGNAARFVKANQEYLSRADSSGLSTGSIDFTLVANVYLDNTTGNFIIIDKSNGTTYDYRLSFTSAGGFRLRVGGGNEYVDSDPVTANTWYMVMAWQDSTNKTINIQLDEGPIHTVSYVNGATDTTGPLLIGAGTGGVTGLDGRVDEAALYKRLLSSDERRWLYNNGTRRTYADVNLSLSNPGAANLVSWWSMDETSGTRYDNQGANHLTDNHAVGYAAGVRGNAAKFVSSGTQSLSVADNASISTGNVDFTVVANIYLNSLGNYVILDKSDNGSTIEYRLSYTTTGGFRFRFGTSQVDSGTVSANAWYTVAAWYDSVNDTLNIQVNNGTVSSVSYSAGAPDTTYPLSFGVSTGGTSPLDGRIDEAVFYKRVLTAGERIWFYNSGNRRVYTDLASSYSPRSYTYSETGPAHAVTALSTGETYDYDANGNMTCRKENGKVYNQIFSEENLLSIVQQLTEETECPEPNTSAAQQDIAAAWMFVYDGDGNLVKKINPDGSHTIYIGGVYEVDKNAGGSTTHTRVYYPAGGAMRIDGTLYFVLKDHLGSASVVTDDEGEPLEGGEQRYYPYGEARFEATMPTDRAVHWSTRNGGSGYLSLQRAILFALYQPLPQSRYHRAKSCESSKPEPV